MKLEDNDTVKFKNLLKNQILLLNHQFKIKTNQDFRNKVHISKQEEEIFLTLETQLPTQTISDLIWRMTVIHF